MLLPGNTLHDISDSSPRPHRTCFTSSRGRSFVTRTACPKFDDLPLKVPLLSCGIVRPVVDLISPAGGALLPGCSWTPFLTELEKCSGLPGTGPWAFSAPPWPGEEPRRRDRGGAAELVARS
ncbi:hypothetical protein Q5P01_003738 [Channa striata]|uniref:Uncharacterized protein n=1 Tax=Channa striata TaxID=64152 RepID=A0AA88NLD4_CHASR|nr:hypothetical protein Q5P01_003738 [Channa striata]